MTVVVYIDDLFAAVTDPQQFFDALESPTFSLPENGCPELNDMSLCGPDDLSKFQSLLGVCQWMISLVDLTENYP